MDDSGFVGTLSTPRIDGAAYVAPGAQLIGDVRPARGASVWVNCVLRSDLANAQIEVGEAANIQDGSVMHIDFDLPRTARTLVTGGDGPRRRRVHRLEACSRAAAGRVSYWAPGPPESRLRRISGKK